MHVLVVDDEAHIRDVVQYAFEQDGYQVTLAADGESALEKLGVLTPDLVVLDVMLPGLDGLALCQRIRRDSRVPILFLSARGEELDRVLGLEMGGDDYLSKPFSPRELLARARAILRRGLPEREASAVLRHGSVELDPRRHRCLSGGTPVILTATEFSLLQLLFEQPEFVFSRSQLMAQVLEGHTTERTVDSHIKRIRAKFKTADAGDPIETVHGVGYRAGG